MEYKSPVVVPYPGRRMREINEDVTLRFEINYDFTLIEVVAYEPGESNARDHSIRRSASLWTEILEIPEMYRVGVLYQFLSRVDGCNMAIRVTPEGRIMLKRNGGTVIIAYETIPTPLQEVCPWIPALPRDNKPCVELICGPLEEVAPNGMEGQRIRRNAVSSPGRERGRVHVRRDN